MAASELLVKSVFLLAGGSKADAEVRKYYKKIFFSAAPGEKWSITCTIGEKCQNIDLFIFKSRGFYFSKLKNNLVLDEY